MHNQYQGSLRAVTASLAVARIIWLACAAAACITLGGLSGAAAQVITEFTVPTTVTSAPWEVTAGPDSALWFTERFANKIGRIDTAGNISEFAIPTVVSFPQGITAGPDGALWFTETYPGKIGRIDTSGNITEFTLPDPGGGPAFIATGPDGALWFTENTSKIGRITTVGVVTEFPVPTANGALRGITAGPDS